METEQTNPKSDPSTQSVLIADKGIVKNYPRDMSNDQIDYDLHTTVRGRTPEDYYVNFLPLKEIQQGWNFLAQNGPVAVKDAIESVPLFKSIGTALSAETKYVDPALKLAVADPSYAFGFSKETSPQAIADTYKPWLDIWRESKFGKVATQDPIYGSDAMLAKGNPIPWFLTEFAPDQLLQFGTKASNWIGAYGIEKFGPPVIDALIKSMPKSVSEVLLKDIFSQEKELQWAHDTLGTEANEKNSTIQSAYRKAAEFTHPDINPGVDPQEFKDVNKAYNAIMESRSGVMDKFYDKFVRSGEALKRSYASVAQPSQTVSRGLLLGQEGSANLIPFSDGDLVRIGEETGKVLKTSGEIAFVNVAGKVHEVPISQLKRYPIGGPENYANLQAQFDKNIDAKDFFPGTKEDVAKIRENIDQVMPAYEKATMKEYGTSAPLVSSGDLPKTMDLPFREKFASGDSMNRHAAGSAVAKMFDEARLSDPANAGKPVLVLAGISGAGKTHVTKLSGKDLGEYALVKDTNLSSFEAGKKFIDKALASGHPVEVNYVKRDPIEAFKEGVYRRFQKNPERRVVTVPIHSRNFGSFQAIKQLAEHYKDDPNVAFNFLENKPGQAPKEITLEEASNPGHTVKQVEQSAKKFLQEELKRKKINEDEYNAFSQGSSEKAVQKNAQASGKGLAGEQVQTDVSAGQESAVNPEHLKISDSAKENLQKATEALGSQLENQTGTPLTHDEVIEAAKKADYVAQNVSRNATKNFEANLLNARKRLAALAEQPELTPEFLDALKEVSNAGTDIARSLESLKIEALPENAAIKVKIIKDLMKIGKTYDEIIGASKGIDWKNEQDVAKFYRQFVQPTAKEQLDEFAYINILSSPITHIVKTASELSQLAVLNPLTKLASGAIDYVSSALTGSERTHYVSEIPKFYKGAINAVPDAIKAAGDAMKGIRINQTPDVRHLPTLSKWVDIATLKVGKYIPRALEASAVFFRTMIEGGEIEALTHALGHAPSVKEAAAIAEKAAAKADYSTFRNRPDANNETGQGNVLSWIDKMTGAVYKFREIPGMKWFVRFVRTPMNILKQHIEYSPAGFLNMIGSQDKADSAGKAVIGSIVFAVGSWLAAAGRTTWAAPTGQKEKNDFYNAGMQPYSIKIGDKWVSYQKIGPLAGPLAMASALHYFTKESPSALSDSEMDKVINSLTGIMKFFSDASYVKGMGDVVSFMQGEKTKAFASVPTQMIPLSSLQGWVNNIIDPLQRKVDSGLSIKSVIQTLEMKIAGMSQLVPPQVDAEETSVKKQFRGVNAVSPYKISKEDPGAAAEYRDRQSTKQELNKMKKELAK